MKLTKDLRIISLRNGVEVSIERERLENIIDLLEKKRFLQIDDRIINTADIVGIFPPQDIENMIRRKNGSWQCNKGTWHEKFEKCNCSDNDWLEEQRKKAKNL
jgi:hypothetical protein